MSVIKTYHPDGSFTLRPAADADPYFVERGWAFTARVREAVARLREDRDPRPVLLVFADVDDRAKALNDQVRARLRGAIAIPPMDPSLTAHVLSRDDARHALRATMGRDASGLFRRHKRPQSHYEALVCEVVVEVTECWTRAAGDGGGAA